MRFKDRISTNQNRRKLKIVSQSASEMIVDVERADTNVTEVGTPLSAEILNGWDSTMSRVNGYIGKVTRTATVVVGLAASGYTTDQVDILIPSGTTDCRNYLQDAINRTPSIGGEVKLLEGEYILQVGFSVQNKEILFSGCGKSTVVKGVGDSRIFDTVSNATLTIRDMFVQTNNQHIAVTRADDTHIKLINCDINTGTDTTVWYAAASTTNTVTVSNCKGFNGVHGKSATNWRNICVDGVAEYDAINIAQEFDMKTASGNLINGLPVLTAGDEVFLSYRVQFVGYNGSFGTLHDRFETAAVGTNFNHYMNLMNNDTATASFSLYYRGSALTADKLYSKSTYNTTFVVQKITLRRYGK